MGLNIGIIMDGNGRWATKRSQPRLVGHQAGVKTVLRVVSEAPALGIDSITLFAFAIANWKRDQEEVDGLWKLFATFFNSHLDELIAKGARIKHIGDPNGLPKEILKLVREAEQKSKNNDAFLLQVALNYDGVDEVARLVKVALETGKKPADIDTNYVLKNLDTVPGAEPDIVIRTGLPAPRADLGIWRSSAFLPLQSAQSVCVGTEVLWPDFSIEHLKEIIAYADPDNRLFGGQRQA